MCLIKSTTLENADVAIPPDTMMSFEDIENGKILKFVHIA